MFARKLKIADKRGYEAGRTPMLVPSISSRLNLDIPELLESVSEGVQGGPLLMSAYDHECFSSSQLSFPSIIFLDSGGYECSRDKDISEIGFYNFKPKPWKREDHSDFIDKWDSPIPTVAICFDHPNERLKTEGQIDYASEFFKKRTHLISEILFKPETESSKRIKPENIADNIHALKQFDIIGFTEKELGYSALDRMTNIGLIRKALDKAKITVPIHIFGSLDTVTTPLYFLAGADIFDGLSWLRFIYDKGDTLYEGSYGPVLLGPNESAQKIWIQSVFHNLRYLRKMEIDMGKFVTKKDYEVFGPRAKFFETTYEDFIEKIEGE
jgi:hypothetical protein